MSRGLSVTVEREADKAAHDAVWDGLRAFNEALTGPGSFVRTPFSATVRDAAGAPLGGLTGYSSAGWLYVELFHLPEPLRRGGLGRRLMAAAEEEARARGLVGVRLETYSFQAPGFYARLGFATVGALHDCPPGHTRYSLAKRLDGAPLETPPCST